MLCFFSSSPAAVASLASLLAPHKFARSTYDTAMTSMLARVVLRTRRQRQQALTPASPLLRCFFPAASLLLRAAFLPPFRHAAQGKEDEAHGGRTRRQNCSTQTERSEADSEKRRDSKAAACLLPAVRSPPSCERNSTNVASLSRTECLLTCAECAAPALLAHLPCFACATLLGCVEAAVLRAWRSAPSKSPSRAKFVSKTAREKRQGGEAGGRARGEVQGHAQIVLTASPLLSPRSCVGKIPLHNLTIVRNHYEAKHPTATFNESEYS